MDYIDRLKQAGIRREYDWVPPEPYRDDEGVWHDINGTPITVGARAVYAKIGNEKNVVLQPCTIKSIKEFQRKVYPENEQKGYSGTKRYMSVKAKPGEPGEPWFSVHVELPWDDYDYERDYNNPTDSGTYTNIRPATANVLKVQNLIILT